MANAKASKPKPCFPYFGAKWRIAPEVWKRFGKVSTYIEPFAGSLAVLMCAPYIPQYIVVNDKNGYITNFWRAVAADPQTVMVHADVPPSEIECEAKLNMVFSRVDVLKKVREDPGYYDAEVAGCWAYCQSALPTGNFRYDYHRSDKSFKPFMSTRRGVCSGVAQIADAHKVLRKAHILSSDFEKALSPAAVTRRPCGIFLDPPYDHGLTGRRAGLYQEDKGVYVRVFRWCLANGSNLDFKICLAGYEGEYDLEGWDCVEWTTKGYFGGNASKKNAAKERLWFSPGCLKP